MNNDIIANLKVDIYKKYYGINIKLKKNEFNFIDIDVAFEINGRAKFTTTTMLYNSAFDYKYNLRNICERIDTLILEAIRLGDE